MATNVSPEYDKAQERYRAALTDDVRLEALREMLATVPKHKASEKLQADLKTKISVLRKSLSKAASTPAKGVFDLFHVPKGGAGQVILIGPPNTGKSMLVATTTNAPVKVAEYPYTTSVPAPGMWQYEDVQIQLVDTPPMTADAIPGGMLGTIRAADLIAIVVDAATEPLEQAEMMLGTLAEKGLKLRSVPRNELAVEDFAQYSAIMIANKIDIAPPDTVATLKELIGDRIEIMPVSAQSGEGLSELSRRLWQMLAVIRIYTKEQGKPVDKEKPYILDLGSTLEDLARTIHRELPEKMTYARAWGDGRFAGVQIPRTEVLRDKDIIEIHE
jgi:hypothetical protein